MQLVESRKEGLYCTVGDFYIDPTYPVNNALITHSHTDHARPGNKKILGTSDTINIMKLRYGKNYCQYSQKIGFGNLLKIKGVNVVAPTGLNCRADSPDIISQVRRTGCGYTC